MLISAVQRSDSVTHVQCLVFLISFGFVSFIPIAACSHIYIVRLFSLPRIVLCEYPTLLFIHSTADGRLVVLAGGYYE